jgi:pimeloyl-ACP methyl ester carboxylesterase
MRIKLGSAILKVVNTVTSKDGTKIAFDKQGNGPAVILVSGALSSRASVPLDLSELLSAHFTVYNYDRRGRGESGDTLPYAVDREIEDIEALIDDAGGPAYLYGHSSGAALAMEATIKLGDKVKKLVMYEAPYSVNDKAEQAWKAFGQQLTEQLKAGRRGDAVASFMKLVLVPDEQIEGMKHSPAWPQFETLAHTLAYDYAVVGEEGVPTARAAKVTVPTLVMNGGKSYDFMLDVAQTLSSVIPQAHLRTLEGQDHNVSPEVLAPVLTQFFNNFK